jgi:glycosyltransferase 2 family protein
VPPPRISSPTATTGQTLAVALGALGVLILLWRIDLAAVRAALVHVGWGLPLILGQEIVAHVFNALGWRFAFARDDAPAFSLTELLRLRVAGDAINYLTPTATIGGEVARTAMLSDARGAETKTVAVIIAKSTQTLAEVFFIVAGLGLVVHEWLAPERLPSVLWWSAGGALVVGLALTCVLAARKHAIASAWQRTLGSRLVAFLRDHPGRVALSTVMFALGYAWGSVEAYWICRFLLVPVTPLTALALEVLSITVDGILFMIPAKIGTQEGGKVAVFAALGLPASLGFAFGVVRHVRELAWAALGLVLCGSAIRRSFVASRSATGSERRVGQSLTDPHPRAGATYL